MLNYDRTRLYRPDQNISLALQTGWQTDEQMTGHTDKCKDRQTDGHMDGRTQEVNLPPWNTYLIQFARPTLSLWKVIVTYRVNIIRTKMVRTDAQLWSDAPLSPQSEFIFSVIDWPTDSLYTHGGTQNVGQYVLPTPLRLASLQQSPILRSNNREVLSLSKNKIFLGRVMPSRLIFFET